MILNRRQWLKGTVLAGVGIGLPGIVSRRAHGQDEVPNGLALAIGLNLVDPRHYGGWSGPLNACEYDAEDMSAIGDSQGFECTVLKTRDATRDAVIREISNAAEQLKAGDIFMLSYSGHGGQVQDRNGDEWDNADETWCLYDGQMLDDELAHLWTKFAPGVRILMFSDSCHSGTVAKFAAYQGFSGIEPISSWDRAKQRAGFEALIDPAAAPAEAIPSPVRAMPLDVAARTYRSNREQYDAIGSAVPNYRKSLDAITATVLLISGCQDNQLSSDGAFNGLFTGKLKQVWGSGRFQGDYRDLHSMILSSMPAYQSPNYYVIGKPNPAFESQRPFAI